MALTFIYGNSGSGKSEYMYRKMADMAEHAPYQRYFVVVPEQFTMSAQRSLARHASSGVITNIDVVSFERLAYRVFDELGVHRTVMEETGKSLVLRRIVEKNEADLTILRRNLTKMGYIGELKSVLSELMQYDIEPEDLEDFLTTLPAETSLSYKLRDILSIYRAFDEYLKDGYVTAERVLDVLDEVADDSALLKGAVLLFDGYTGFTPVQMKLLRRLMPLVSDLYVTVTLDAREPLYANARMEDLFYMSRKMVRALCDAARETAFPIAEPIRIDAHEKSRFSGNPVLSHLEQNLFRIPTLPQNDACEEHIHIFSLPSPREELSHAAAVIRRLVREKGYRYRECAIVCADVQEYEKYADSVFSRYEIPCFVDAKQTVLYHPLTELLRAVLEIAQTDYTNESVFRLLRTGLTDLTPREIDTLENYCIEKGVRGRTRWQKPFEKLQAQNGRLREEDAVRETALAEINALRERVAALCGEVCPALRKKDATVRARTEALYRFLVSLGVEEKLREETARFEECGDEPAAAKSRQMYRIVIDLFDKMVDLLGEEELSLSDYIDILEAGFACARVATIPAGSDCVILGDIERTRLDDIKVLFFLGVNDGQVPKKSGRQSILSQYDREVLEAHDLMLAPGEREQMFLQRFYLYLTLTKPSDALYLSFVRMDAEGKAVRPSYLIATLQKLFPRLAVEEIATHEMLPLVTAKSGVESYLTGLVASDGGVVTPQWKALHAWYLGQKAYAAQIGALFDAHFPVHRPEHLTAALAQTLFGSVPRTSVTRLERFGSCAFAHFLEYGLKLAERPEADFASPDMGSVFHGVLEYYGKRVDATVGWREITEERRDALLREALNETIAALGQEALTETASGKQTVERIYRILRRSVWAVTEQIRRGDFSPYGYEVQFSEAEGGSDGTSDSSVRSDGMETRMRLVGVIDRMDLCETEGRFRVRVIDYKSSGMKLNLENVYYGRQLQLPVYLMTATQLLSQRYPGAEIVPGGLFYLHLDDPLVEDAGDEEDVQRAILKEMKPEGLVNIDPDVYLRMDRGLAETSESDVIPLGLKQDGTPKKSSANTERQQFEDLTRYAGQVIDEAAERMKSGSIEVNPYRLGDRTGCDYCAFRSVCGFDPRIPGYAFREERHLTRDEAWEAIREALHDKE